MTNIASLVKTAFVGGAFLSSQRVRDDRSGPENRLLPGVAPGHVQSPGSALVLGAADNEDFDIEALSRSAGAAMDGDLETGRWRYPLKSDVRRMFAADPVFKEAFEREDPGSVDRWLDGLVEGIERTCRFNTWGNGVILSMRFRHAYGNGNVAHLAMASVWVDPETNQHRVDFCHQESIPKVDAEGNVSKGFRGQVFSTFDTAPFHPLGVSPVAESIKLLGLPDVYVFCAIRYPRRLSSSVEELKEVTHDYASGPGAPGGPEAIAAGVSFADCFAITFSALMSVLTGKPVAFTGRQDSGTIFLLIADFTNTDGSKFPQARGAFGEGKTLRQVLIAYRPMAGGWGNDGSYDARPARSAKEADVRVEAGPLVLDGPDVSDDWEQMQFRAQPKGVTLDGAQVRTGETYSREESERMQVEQGGEGLVKVWVASPAQG